MSVKGRGSVLSYGDPVADPTSSPLSSSYTAFAKLVEFQEPEIDVEETEGRHMTSPDFYNEPEATWKAPGEATVRLRFNKAEYTAISAMLGVTKAWQYVLSDGSKTEFLGWVKGLSKPTPIDGLVDVTFTIRATGKFFFTPAA